MKTFRTHLSPSGGTYTPGYASLKQSMVLGGVILLLFGLTQLWHPLRLVLWGARAKAEAVRVVKEKSGLPPRVLTDSIQVQSQLEPRDRSYVFWNEFRFSTREGKVFEVRANVGGQLKPLYSLTDADGLPTTDLVCYDAGDPTRAIFPLIVSTWLAPAMLIFAGLAAAIIGSFLLYWANKPIEMPQIPPAGATTGIGKPKLGS